MIKHLTKPIRAIHFMVLAFLMTIGAQVSAETIFEYEGNTYRVDLQGLYCPPPKGSDYEKLFRDQAFRSKNEGNMYFSVHTIWCKGPTITKGKNRVISGVRIGAIKGRIPGANDQEIENQLYLAMTKDLIQNLMEDQDVKQRHNSFKEYRKRMTRVDQGNDYQVSQVQVEPIPILMTTHTLKVDNDETTNMIFQTLKVEKGQIFAIYLDDNLTYPNYIDHSKILTNIALSLDTKE